MPSPAPEPAEPVEEASEKDNFEQVFKGLLTVPKAEVTEREKKDERP